MSENLEVVLEAALRLPLEKQRQLAVFLRQTSVNFRQQFMIVPENHALLPKVYVTPERAHRVCY
jgi:hypothetical protein